MLLYLEHVFYTVLVDAGNILLLSDLEFIQSMVEYFKNVFSDIKPPQLNEEEIDSIHASLPSSKSPEEGGSSKPMNIPYIKIEANVKDVRIGVIETEEAPDPQALLMKVCVCL